METNQINLQQLLSSLFISFLQQIFIENYILYKTDMVLTLE